jgi:hypothetical protein
MFFKLLRLETITFSDATLSNINVCYATFCPSTSITFIGLDDAQYTDKKEKEIFLIYKEIQNRAVAKSYTRKGFLIYEEMRKYLVIRVYEEGVSHN